MQSLPIASLYTQAVRSFVELARTLTPEDWATPVPCTPGWTARDVLSHVSGVPDDALAGRLDGVATDPWTASQVERNAAFPVDELLDRWESQQAAFGEAVESMGERRPPFDCHSHEHDVRHALDRPGNRSSPMVDAGAVALVEALSDLDVALTVDLGDGRTIEAGDQHSDTRVTLTTTPFEIFRSRLGRRTRGQVRSLPWTGADGAIDSVVDAWFSFGPSPTPIEE